MAKTTIAEWKQRVMDAEEGAAYLGSLVEAFMTGELPNNASLQHHVMAQWGRKRLESMRKTPALLVR